MKKSKLLILISLIFTITLSGCGPFSKSAQLSRVEINIDGDPSEWKPFPSVHEDKEDDNISIDFDMSTIKAFTNSETGKMYILIESYISPKEITSVELDLKYGDELYRVGLPTGKNLLGAIAKENEENQWESVTDQLEFTMVIAEAAEISFPAEYFPDPNNLKIAAVRIMGGICCNQYEYYAIDYMD